MADELQQITLDMLPPELRALIDKFTNEQGVRSPVRKPLTDLRTHPDPKKMLHRPTFFFEYGPDLDPYRHQVYPKLMWNDAGREITVTSARHESTLGDGWTDLPPIIAFDPTELARQQFEDLSDEDKALVLQSFKESRMAAMKKRLEGLSESELEVVLGAATPLKRKPGRPKKTAVQ